VPAFIEGLHHAGEGGIPESSTGQEDDSLDGQVQLETCLLGPHAPEQMPMPDFKAANHSSHLF
jgi:hypothetical protein